MVNEAQTGVTVESPSTETPVVEQVQVDAAQTVEQPQVEANHEEVPEHNRQMEAIRKAGVFEKIKKVEDTEKKLDEVLNRLNALQQTNNAPKYTVDQLEQFVEETDSETNRNWAKSEIRRLQKEEQSNLVKTELEKFQQNQKSEMVRQQTMSRVLTRNPDIMVRDPYGNFAGWNTESPMFQRMSQYMNDPSIQSRPDGFELAEKLAYADLQRSNSIISKGEIQKQKAAIKTLQQKTLVEGGNANQQVPQRSEYSDTMDSFAKSGSLKDATKLFKQRLKARGVIKE